MDAGAVVVVDVGWGFEQIEGIAAARSVRVVGMAGEVGDARAVDGGPIVAQ